MIRGEQVFRERTSRPTGDDTCGCRGLAWGLVCTNSGATSGALGIAPIPSRPSRFCQSRPRQPPSRSHRPHWTATCRQGPRTEGLRNQGNNRAYIDVSTIQTSLISGGAAMRLMRILVTAATCATLIIVMPFGGQVIGPQPALAHGSNGGAAGGGGHGGSARSGAVAGSQAAGHSGDMDHAGMEHAAHRSRSSCGGADSPYTGPGSGHTSGC